MTIPVEEGSRLSDVELLCRAISYSRPYGLKIVEKWRAVASLFGIGESVALSLCKLFGVDPDEYVAR